MDETQPNRMNQLLLAIVMTVSLVLIVASGALGYYLGKNDVKTNRVTTPTPWPTNSLLPSTRPTESPVPTGGEVYCTMDAKQCPDGSWVGRVGPKCNFAPCPGEGAITPTVSPAPKGETETVDFGACNTNGGFRRDVGFGSTSLQVLRSEANVCVVKTVNEVEGGVSTSQCSVPKSLGSVTFTIGMTGTDFSAIKPYCNINSTTHINIQN